MKLWTGVDGKLHELTVKDCKFPCQLADYKNLVVKMMPDKEDNWCLSNECSRELFEIQQKTP